MQPDVSVTGQDAYEVCALLVFDNEYDGQVYTPAADGEALREGVMDEVRVGDCEEDGFSVGAGAQAAPPPVEAIVSVPEQLRSSAQGAKRFRCRKGSVGSAKSTASLTVTALPHGVHRG